MKSQFNPFGQVIKKVVCVICKQSFESRAKNVKHCPNCRKKR